MPEPLSQRVYRGRSAAQRAQARKQKLLDGAREVIGSVGFSAARITDICRAAGVSQRYFYEAFTDSEDLLIQLYEQEVARLAAAVGPHVVVEAPVSVAAIRSALSTFFRTLEANRNSARILFFEVHGASRSVKRAYRAGRRQFGELLFVYVRPILLELGPDELDDEVVAIGLVGALLELTRSWLRGDLEASVDELVEKLMAIYARFTGR